MLAVILLPPLIQTTSLSGDYQALAYLDLLKTPLLTQENGQQAYDNVKCSCVRIQVDGHYGSGSILKMSEDEIIITTNKHVLQYWNEDSYITFFDGAVAEGQVLGMAEKADVGFIRVFISAFSWEQLLTYRNVRIIASDINDQETTEITTLKGKNWFSIDFATDIWNPQLYSGSIIEPSVMLEDFEVEMLYGQGEAKQGMSGGGVFDECGNYIGMMTGGTLRDEIAAVPARTIWKEYADIINRL